MRQLTTSDAIQADKVKDAKLAEVTARVAELEQKIANEVSKELHELRELLQQ